MGSLEPLHSGHMSHLEKKNYSIEKIISWSSKFIWISQIYRFSVWNLRAEIWNHRRDKGLWVRQKQKWWRRRGGGGGGGGGGGNRAKTLKIPVQMTPSVQVAHKKARDMCRSCIWQGLCARHIKNFTTQLKSGKWYLNRDFFKDHIWMASKHLVDFSIIGHEGNASLSQDILLWTQENGYDQPDNNKCWQGCREKQIVLWNVKLCSSFGKHWAET